MDSALKNSRNRIQAQLTLGLFQFGGYKAVIEHLETIKLMPLPNSQQTSDEHLDIELMLDSSGNADSSMLIILRSHGISVQISRKETEKLIAALQRGIQP